MAVKAWLAGDQQDLQHLADLLQSGDVQVLREGERYYLAATNIDSPPPDKTHHKVAQALIVHINGLARAQRSSYQSVRLSGTYEDETGRQHAVAAVALELRLEITATAVVRNSDGTIASTSSSPWPDWLALAEKNSDVAEALEHMGGDEPPDWDGLWKVFEIIREAVKPDTIITLGWTTQADLESFKESANRQDVSGTAARHARRPGQPQHRRMPIDEGRSYLSGLVTKWLCQLAGRP